MTNSITSILLRNNYVDFNVEGGTTKASIESISTVLMNLEYYGYRLTAPVYKVINNLSEDGLAEWWKSLEIELRSVTGDDRNIGDFVVYKNFPEEVLKKSEAEYWIPQILMYWGFPASVFTEEVEPRDGMNPAERKSKALHLADDKTLQSILNSLVSSGAKWKRLEQEDTLFLSNRVDLSVDFSKFGFKENLVCIVKSYLKEGRAGVSVSTATDVLRVAAALCDGDVSLKENAKFRFNRSTRRFLLSSLEGCGSIEEDFARRKVKFKKLMKALRVGDYAPLYPRVRRAYDKLYNGKIETFNSKVERLIKEKNAEVFDLLEHRPGEFARRIVHLIDVFGTTAVASFIGPVSGLTVNQMLMLRSHLESANDRTKRIFAPKGDWSKAQLGDVRPVRANLAKKLIDIINTEIARKVPAVKQLDPECSSVKIPTNGSDEGSYTRGTVFDIPDNVKFIRTASYWENSGRTSWFDNGWNFFDDNWKGRGACCWNHNQNTKGAFFSGDPVNSKEMKGRAAQLIDIYPEKLRASGIRYAVWSVLCYSGIKFSEATDVFAALQWGEDPQKGKLFEPSRCQLSFQLKGDYKTKYVCVLDLKTMQMTYIDANLGGSTSSAQSNNQMLSEKLPVYMETMKSIPSIYDLFKHSVDEENGEGRILYTDEGIEFEDKETAYVFKKIADASYEDIDINKILTA